MNVCGAGSAPTLEGIVGASVVLRLTAAGADGSAMDLTGAVVNVYVAAVPATGSTPTYSSTGTGPRVAVVSPATSGVFTITTSPVVDAVAGFFRYIITVTPSGAAAVVIAHGVYAVATQ